MTESYRTPLDNLPDDRIGDALAFARYIRAAGVLAVAPMTYQGQLAVDLRRAGVVRYAPAVCLGVPVWIVMPARQEVAR